MGNMAGEPLPRMTVYNPALLKKEALIAQFSSGKTTLLRRLRYAIEDDTELYSH
jgi:hypothetical protein